jgi:hypothetical protein
MKMENLVENKYKTEEWWKFMTENGDNTIEVDFSVNESGEIEFTDVLSGDISEEWGEKLIQLLLDKNRLIIDQRTKGIVTYSNGEISCDYEVCTDIGEDWGDEEWEDKMMSPIPLLYVLIND